MEFENKIEIGDEALRERVVFDVRGHSNEVLIEEGVVVRGALSITIHGNGNVVTIGRGCRFERDASILFLPATSSAKMDGGFVRIGAECQFNGGEVLFYVGEVSTGIEIGERCLFAEKVRIRTSDNHRIYDSGTGDRLNSGASVFVSDRVWLCEGVSLLKGSRVPCDSVVGLGSVVSGRFEESGVVIVGNPARVVRRGVCWRR